MTHARRWIPAVILAPAIVAVFFSCSGRSEEVEAKQDPPKARAAPRDSFDDAIEANVRRLVEEGRRIFRSDTFGSEAFWGGQLKLHTAILGDKLGGVGIGLTPSLALKAGLKVDAAALPKGTAEAIQSGTANLDDPATTVALLKSGAVVGVSGVFDTRDRLISVGITCALCHSTVDDSFSKGIGRRLDGWPNRDLNVGEIVALAPELRPFEESLKLDAATIRSVLRAWGPGKYDAVLNLDGKAKGPYGQSAATLIPPLFGLAGQNLATSTGWGSIPYWNAYVANTQMHGRGTFFDPRLKDAERFPAAARSGANDLRDTGDAITPKLEALHFYQLSIPAPKPPAKSFDAKASERGAFVFNGKAKCATCHVPPLFSEPGWPMHSADEMGIDDFQSGRSPNGLYRTAPLRGLFARTKGGFYHDGRFADLAAVVSHYERLLNLHLTPSERKDLIEYLKSL